MNRRRLATLAATATATVAVGCGGSGGDDAAATADNPRSQFRDAALEYARCMRKNGVDVPDPQPGEGGRLMFGGPDGADPDTPGIEQADEKCREKLENVRPPELSGEQQKEFQDAALAFARCMRGHGIDMPDPQFDGDVMQQRIGGPEFDPDDPAFQEAEDACRDKLPEGGPGGASPGGP